MSGKIGQFIVSGKNAIFLQFSSCNQKRFRLNKILSYRTVFILLAVIAVVASGCSRKKAGFTNKLYHNTTSHYNWYFNANEILVQTEEQFWLNKTDNYLELLPVYVLPNEVEQKNLYPQMDLVIEKASTVIDRHSMMISKQEYNKWIDDNYLLIGIANYYKGNYATAQEMFSYVVKKYKSGSSRFDAALWLARTYVEQKNYGRATTVLSAIEKDNSKDRPKDFQANIEIVLADKFLRQQRYKEALPHLEDAAALTRDKRMKARITFITAQCYQKENRSQLAIDYFAKVVDMKPDYEMEFYAKISQALAFDRKLDSGKIKSMLNGMAKDKQNEKYLDQIYYALAEIELEEQHYPEGKELLLLSARKSINNPRQKGMSYLRLADIYFVDRQYTDAKNYYDSTAAFLPEDYPNYKNIISKGLSLNDLVYNLNIIEVNDSLLTLVGMDEKDRNKKIIQVIVQLEREAEEKRLAELEALEKLQYGTVTASPRGGAAGGSGKNWYFYNPNTLSSGFQEFQQRWGQTRKLEDNWRRKNKAETGGFANAPIGQDDSTLAQLGGIPPAAKTLEDYLTELPLSDSAQAGLHNEIIAALYDIGVIYKENLSDADNAIESFLRVTSDYDTSATAPSAYYQLYRIYLQKEQTGGFVGTGYRDNSDFYKDVILADYPTTEYARLIRDPNYISDKNKNFAEEKLAYEETYKKYSRRQYNDVLIACNEVIQQQPENNFLSKYYLIKALAISARYDATAFENVLREIIAKFPGTEEGFKATELLGDLNEAKAKLAREQATTDKTTTTTPDPVTNTPAAPDPANVANTSMFNIDNSAEHFFALIFPKEGVAATDLKELVSDFNTSFFSTSNLRITNSFIDKDSQIIIVRSFEDKTKAMDYYNTFLANQGLLKELNERGYQRFIITTKNFTVLFRNKNPQDYGAFFGQNYL